MPWSLTGMLVMSFIEALGVTAVTHPDLTPVQRLENSLTCFLLLDLGRLLAHEKAQRDGVKKGSYWLPHQTHDNLQELNVLMAIATLGLPQNLDWNPHRSTELPLEIHFGTLRSHFASSQMRCRDYLQAQAKRHFATKQKIAEGCEPRNPDPCCPAPVSEDEFVACSKRASGAALSLMACSCAQLGFASDAATDGFCGFLWVFWKKHMFYRLCFFVFSVLHYAGIMVAQAFQIRAAAEVQHFLLKCRAEHGADSLGNVWTG